MRCNLSGVVNCYQMQFVVKDTIASVLVSSSCLILIGTLTIAILEESEYYNNADLEQPLPLLITSQYVLISKNIRSLVEKSRRPPVFYLAPVDP